MTPHTPADIELPALPDVDLLAGIRFNDTPYITGYPASYVYSFAEDFARAAVLADRARTAASCAGWRPIETAPAGTTDSILICTEGFPGSTEEVFWHDGSECYGHRGEAGWFSESDRGNLLTASNAHGTHWMPLPPAPGAPATVRAERTDAAHQLEQMSADLTRAKNLLIDIYNMLGRKDISAAEARRSIEKRTGAWFAWGTDRNAARAVPAPTAGDAGGADHASD